MKEALLEKLKYKEAEKYASSLLSVEQMGILSQMDIPREVSECISGIIRYDAKPDSVLSSSVKEDELIDWVLSSQAKVIVYF